MTQVGMRVRYTEQLMVGESRASREIPGGPKFLIMNPKVWEAFIEETPFAPYYNRGRMTYYNCKIILDDNEPNWRFSNAETTS